jgi:hypothetical protein
VRRSISLIVPAASNPGDSLWLHLLAIFRGNLLDEFDDSQDDQDLGSVPCRGGECDQPDILQDANSVRIDRSTKQQSQDKALHP